MAASLQGATKTLNPEPAAPLRAAMRCCHTVHAGNQPVRTAINVRMEDAAATAVAAVQLHLYDTRLPTAAGGSEGEDQGGAKVERQGGGGQVEWQDRSREDSCQGCAEP